MGTTKALRYMARTKQRRTYLPYGGLTWGVNVLGVWYIIL